MMPFRVGVIAGTSDATDLIHGLPVAYAVTAFAATPYGAEILMGENCTVQVGRLDTDGFVQALSGMHAVVDASHPFAVIVTETVQQACRRLGAPYLRLKRQEVQYAYKNVFSVTTKEEAAVWLSATVGNLLFTTGVNTLSFYETHVSDFAKRAWVRILDTPESHRIAADSNAKLIYAMPPFSVQDTVDLLQHFSIAVLITKDSGVRGGVPEKIKAAQLCNIPVLLLRAPDEQGLTISQIIAKLLEIEGRRSHVEG